MKTESKFTFFWRDGKREVLAGSDAADALSRAGYGGGALRALDFHAKGDNDEYEYDSTARDWNPKPDSAFGRELARIRAASSPTDAA